MSTGSINGIKHEGLRKLYQFLISSSCSTVIFMYYAYEIIFIKLYKGCKNVITFSTGKIFVVVV